MTVIFCIILTSVSILISGGVLLYFNKFKKENDINVQLNSFTENFQKNINEETQKLSDKIYKDIDSIVTHINSIYKTIETITNGITKISEKIQSINNFNETTIAKVNELTTELSTQRISIDDIKHNNIDKESIINDVNQKINTYTTFVNNLISTSLSSNNEVSKLYNTLQEDIMTLKTNNTDLEKNLNTIKNYIPNNNIKFQNLIDDIKLSISVINNKITILYSKIEKEEETNTQALIDTITPSKSNMEIIKPKQKVEDNIDINNIIINKVDKKQQKPKKDNISEETNNKENNIQLTNINAKPHNADSNSLNKKIKDNSRIIIK